MARCYKSVGHKAGNVNSYEILAEAIVLQAARDYIKWFRKLLKNSDNTEALYEVNRLKIFFLGDFFKEISDFDGKTLICRIEKEISHERETYK